MDTILSDLNKLQPADLDAGQVFSGKASGKLVKGYAQPSAYTPAIDPAYIFHEASRDVIVWFSAGNCTRWPLCMRMRIRPPLPRPGWLKK